MPNSQPLPEINPEISQETPTEKGSGSGAEQPEAEIKELKERIDKLESQLGKEKVPGDKEKMVKQEIKSYLQELQKTPPTAPPVATRDEAEEVRKFPANQQVGALISLVFEKGLKKAISVANDIDNPAILDEFHDTLVDRYYKELIEGKIIKE